MSARRRSRVRIAARRANRSERESRRERGPRTGVVLAAGRSKRLRHHGYCHTVITCWLWSHDDRIRCSSPTSTRSSAASTRRLSARRRHRIGDLPGGDAGPPTAAGGRTGGREDDRCEDPRRRAGHTAAAAAVLRGPDRGRSALRLELPAPAAVHPARRGTWRRHRRIRPVHRGVPGEPPDPAVRPVPRARRRRCC